MMELLWLLAGLSGALIAAWKDFIRGGRMEIMVSDLVILAAVVAFGPIGLAAVIGTMIWNIRVYRRSK